MAIIQNERFSDYQNVSLGKMGHRILTAAETSVSGEYFVALQALEDAVVDYTSGDGTSVTIDGNTFGGDTSAANLPLPVGAVIFGTFTDVTCDSGTVIAYIG